MFVLEKKYKGGKKALFYLFLKKGWLLSLFGIGFFYLSWTLFYGNLRIPTENFLADHPDWYLNVGMLSQWSLLLGISLLFIAFLNAHVHHRYYKFMLDRHAVHLHRGWFFIRETTIPYHQISNVHIGRPYHYRMLGIAQLDIVTAADKDFEKINNKTKTFLMPVIDITLARMLSRYLLEASAKSRRGKYADEEDDVDEDEEVEDSDEIVEDDDLDEENKA
jgi:uncharacterized membrane protein YdbT with pleckstrin-like domain